MALLPPLWTTVTESSFAHERAALQFIQERLPNHDPYRAWANFLFFGTDGSINEVDLLVHSPVGVFLVEIKSHPGKIRGDALTWIWEREGRSSVLDNPLRLTDLKCKRLATLLKRHMPPRSVPFIEPLIFLSDPDLKCELDPYARHRVLLSDRDEEEGRFARPGIVQAIKNRTGPGLQPTTRFPPDAKSAQALERALSSLGLRPSTSSKRVGDYMLHTLLHEGPGKAYQDWVAQHTTIESSKRRVRLYLVNDSTTEEQRGVMTRAARREFELLGDVRHEGILPIFTYTEHSTGPALLMDYLEDEARLDHFLMSRGQSLSVEDKVDLIRSIAEALQYGHRMRLVHLALGPQSILVREVKDERGRRKLKTRIFNWQLAGRFGTNTVRTYQSTRHVDDLIEEDGALYVAPEVRRGMEFTPAADLFSLGLLTYLVFTGRPPAESAGELDSILATHRFIDITPAFDGTVFELRELLVRTSAGDVSARLGSVTEFLGLLDDYEKRLTQVDAEPAINPLEARVGDVLEGGLFVKHRLGQGSTAAALVVARVEGEEGEQPREREYILKVALEPSFNNRLRAEYKILTELRHENIVRVYEEVEIAGLRGFLMQRTANETLAERLQKQGTLHLEFLERWGTDLLSALRYLEALGVGHRDIKPDNIGLAMLGKLDQLRLILFDFSLSSVPLENLEAGTPRYLDPFLRLRKARRWDPAADRFALAVTLHEMATGELPIWGDGQSAPDLIDDEVSLKPEKFDRGVRDSLVEFFTIALRRDAAARFHTAEEMLKAWERVFLRAGEPALPRKREGLDDVTPGTALIELGLSNRALGVLDRLNLVNVGDLCAYPLRNLKFERGVGRKTQEEITSLYARLKAKFPSIEVVQEAPEGAERVEEIVQRLFPVGDEAKHRIRDLFFCLGDGPLLWLTQKRVAELGGSRPDVVSRMVHQFRERGGRSPSLTVVRKLISGVLPSAGGVMTEREVGLELLSRVGCEDADPSTRLRLGLSLARAAAEVESAVEEPSFQERRFGERVVLALSDSLADWAVQLGQVASALLERSSIVETSVAVSRLRAIAPPEGGDLNALTDARLLSLAAGVSDRAAVSRRLELYRKDLSAVDALRACHAALLHPLRDAEGMSVEDVQKRVGDRFREAVPLPGRPQLDSLLEEAGAPIVFDRRRELYVRRAVEAAASGESAEAVRAPTRIVPIPPRHARNPEVEDAVRFEEKLSYHLRKGGSLILTTESKLYPFARREIAERLKVQEVNLEGMVIELLREKAQSLPRPVRWDLVLAADSAPIDSFDRKQLNTLAALIKDDLSHFLLSLEGTVLLTYPGLLGRYQLVQVLEDVGSRLSLRRSGEEVPLTGALLLVAPDENRSGICIEGKELPTTSWQVVEVPRAWATNEHRSTE